MKKVLVICPYPENVAPSQRLKFEQYYPYFREQGYEVEVSSFISSDFWKIIYKQGFFLQKSWYTMTGYYRRIKDLFRIKHYDVVYIHLWVTPFGPPLFEYLFRKLASKIVYDIDDLVYLKRTNKAHPIVSLIKGRKKPIYLMKYADHVITCTPYLDEFVKRWNKNTTDISSTINTDTYKPKTDYNIKEKFSIGWSGSHSTSKYLHLLDSLLLELAQEIDFRLVVMGDISFSLPGVEINTLPWDENYEVEVIRSFDVGLYPLPDEEWVLGKSGLKALQYMALGVPTIATAIGTIHRIIEDGENGYLVSKPLEWKDKILKLYHSQQLREEIGKASVRTINEHYSVRSNKAIYLSILDSLTT